MMQLNDQEMATVLAALRYFQHEIATYGELAITQGLSHFDDVDPLSLEAIDVLCERLNEGDELPVEGLGVTLKDWRLYDGLSDEVSHPLQGDYRITLSQGSYGNLVMTMQTPIGDQSLLHIEAENNHFKVMMHCPDEQCPSMPRDDCSGICRITPDGVIVNSGISSFLVLDGEDTRKVPVSRLQELIGILNMNHVEHPVDRAVNQ